MLSRDRDIVGLGLVTRVASSGARVIARPFTNTVNGTLTQVAFSIFSDGAFLTTILSLNGDNIVAGLGTLLTSLGAEAIFTPVTFTVNWAHSQEAVFLFNVSIFEIAFTSPTRFGGGDNESTVGETFFAGGRAIGPFSEITFTFSVGGFTSITDPARGAETDTRTVAKLIFVGNNAVTVLTAVNIMTAITVLAGLTNVGVVADAYTLSILNLTVTEVAAADTITWVGISLDLHKFYRGRSNARANGKCEHKRSAQKQ
jgi:hypothetical protein